MPGGTSQKCCWQRGKRCAGPGPPGDLSCRLTLESGRDDGRRDSRATARLLFAEWRSGQSIVAAGRGGSYELDLRDRSDLQMAPRAAMEDENVPCPT